MKLNVIAHREDAKHILWATIGQRVYWHTAEVLQLVWKDQIRDLSTCCHA